MHIRKTCKNYFHPSISRKNTKTKNGLAVLKIASYFTVVCPLTVGTVLGVATLGSKLISIHRHKHENDPERRASDAFHSIHPINNIDSETVENDNFLRHDPSIVLDFDQVVVPREAVEQIDLAKTYGYNGTDLNEANEYIERISPALRRLLAHEGIATFIPPKQIKYKGLFSKEIDVKKTLTNFKANPPPAPLLQNFFARSLETIALDLTDEEINSSIKTFQILIGMGANPNLCWFSAIERGHLTAARVLTQCSGIDIHAVNEDGQTALHIAARLPYDRSFPLIDFLIEQNLDVNQQDNEGNTPLHLATSPNQRRLLRNEEINPNIKNNNGLAFWHSSSQGAYLRRIAFKNDKIDFQLVSGNRSLQDSILYSFCDEVPSLENLQRFLNKCPINEKNIQLYQRLFLVTIERGHLILAQALAQSSKTIIQAVNEDGQTAFHIAAKLPDHQSFPLIDFLIEQNLGVNQQDNEGNTALHLATPQNQERLLRNEQINPNIKNNNGLAFWHMSYRDTYQPTSQIAFKNDKIDFQVVSGENSLQDYILYSYSNHFPTAKDLQRFINKCPINEKNTQLYQRLLSALIIQDDPSTELIQILLDNGLSPDFEFHGPENNLGSPLYFLISNAKKISNYDFRSLGTVEENAISLHSQKIIELARLLIDHSSCEWMDKAYGEGHILYLAIDRARKEPILTPLAIFLIENGANLDAKSKAGKYYIRDLLLSIEEEVPLWLEKGKRTFPNKELTECVKKLESQASVKSANNIAT